VLLPLSLLRLLLLTSLLVLLSPPVEWPPLLVLRVLETTPRLFLLVVLLDSLKLSKLLVLPWML
jgi:hypothetical protein